MAKKPKTVRPKKEASQIERFKAKARELGVDESPGALERAFKKIAPKKVGQSGRKFTTRTQIGPLLPENSLKSSPQTFPQEFIERHLSAKLVNQPHELRRYIDIKAPLPHHYRLPLDSLSTY